VSYPLPESLLGAKPCRVYSVRGVRAIGSCDHCSEERVLVASLWLAGWLCRACLRREYELRPHQGGAPAQG